MGESDEPKPVAEVDDLPVGTVRVVEAGGEPVALVHTEDGFYALSNTCPHSGGPLGEGTVEDDSIYCPWHGYQFELATGDHAQGLPMSAETYEVDVRDGRVFLTP